jgi:hypothetical protein
LYFLWLVQYGILARQSMFWSLYLLSPMATIAVNKSFLFLLFQHGCECLHSVDQAALVEQEVVIQVSFPHPQELVALSFPHMLLGGDAMVVGCRQSRQCATCTQAHYQPHVGLLLCRALM